MLLRLLIVLNWTRVTLALWNCAQWKPTSQSSNMTDATGRSLKAVDGIKDPDYYNSLSCSHTNIDKVPWWLVNLLGQYRVKKVNIVNRLECCRERLVNFRIDFFETDPRNDPQFPYVTGRTCATHGSKILPGGDNVFTCAPGTVGRFGLVVKHPEEINKGDHVLTMCEFEAMVDEVYSHSIHYTLSQDVRATEGFFLSLQSRDHLACAAECNSRRDTDLCTAFNWNQERRECRLLSVSPYNPVNQISEDGWGLYRTTSY